MESRRTWYSNQHYAESPAADRSSCGLSMEPGGLGEAPTAHGSDHGQMRECAWWLTRWQSFEVGDNARWLVERCSGSRMEKRGEGQDEQEKTGKDILLNVYPGASMAGKSVPLEGQEARPDVFLLSFCPDFTGSNALDQAHARQMIDSACRLPCAVSGCNDTMPTKSRDCPCVL